MTPQQLRQRADRNIRSARSLLDSDPDHAAELAAFAVEFALKARYCTRHGVSNFPSDHAQAKKLGLPKMLLSHDLEELLKLSDDCSIKTTNMHRIDWHKATDWDPDKRYTPVGTMSRSDVEQQVNETAKLFFEFVLWEIVEKLLAVEIAESQEWGPFTFFALVHDHEVQGWSVWYSDWNAYHHLRTELIVARIMAALDEDLFATIKSYVVFHPHAPIIRAFTSMVTGLQHFKMKYMASNNLITGFGVLPSAFLITCQRRPEPIYLPRVGLK